MFGTENVVFWNEVIKLEWEAYARAVEADAWAGGAPSSQLEDLAKSLAKV